MMKNNRKVILFVLDGFGINKRYKGNAISKAKMPFYDDLKKDNLFCQLGASEQYVGLPKGQLGSSEVGHTTLGAGKIINSDIVRINKSIEDKSFFENKLLKKTLNKSRKRKLHLVGLISDGGIHAYYKHLFAILDACRLYKNKNVKLHLFTDGRDMSPTSSLKLIRKLQKKLDELGFGSIASIAGRYYGMDRDNHWDRQKKVYDVLVNGSNYYSEGIENYIKDSYKKEITDEFIEPVLFDRTSTIENNDSIIFCNFRSDRAREFTKMFVDKKFDKFETKKLNINFVSLTQYDSKLKGAKVLFPPVKQEPGIGQILSKLKYKQLRVAETEKFAHVTYFFNLGQEKPNKYEDRILVPSPGVLTYDLKPEMGAKIITKQLIPTLDKDYKFTLINFANGDMVGHTGNIEATIKGLEIMDSCLKIIFNYINFDNTDVIIVADHGNCDEMIYEDGSVSTSHSLNKVPFILISKDNYSINKEIIDPSLANIAPTVLQLLKIEIPKYMTTSLIKNKE